MNLVAEKISHDDSTDSTIVFKEKIEKLKMMYDCGMLTDEEFAEEKRKVLSYL